MSICSNPPCAPPVMQSLCAELTFRLLMDDEQPFNWQVGPTVLSWEDGRWEVDGLWEVDDAYVVDLLTNAGGAFTPIP